MVRLQRSQGIDCVLTAPYTVHHVTIRIYVIQHTVCSVAAGFMCTGAVLLWYWQDALARCLSSDFHRSQSFLTQDACSAAQMAPVINPKSRGALTKILLVGGATRMSAVRHFLTNMTGLEPLEGAVNPDEAVALGAAVQVGGVPAFEHNSWRKCTGCLGSTPLTSIHKICILIAQTLLHSLW